MSRHLPVLAIVAIALILPFATDNLYYLHIATMIAVYLILIATLNLLVGFTGQLSVGHVGLLAIGAYVFSILGTQFGWNSFAALAAAGVISAVIGFLLGLPSLRFPGFYFAMVTTAFGMTVAELALAWRGLTNGSIGMSAPTFPAPFDTPVGFYYLAAGLGAYVTLLTWNLARSMWSRAMIAVRDSSVAASSVAVRIHWTKLVVFVFSGLTAGLAGGLFATSELHHAGRLHSQSRAVLLRVDHHRRARGHSRTLPGRRGARSDPRARRLVPEIRHLLLRARPALRGADGAWRHR